jgi:hypothetical protein
LAKHDLNLNEKFDDDEMEIMEQKIDTIEVLSDDEDEKNEASTERSVENPILQLMQDENHNVQQVESATDVVEQQESPATLTTDAELIASRFPKLSKKTFVKVVKLKDAKLIDSFIEEFGSAKTSDGNRLLN